MSQDLAFGSAWIPTSLPTIAALLTPTPLIAALPTPTTAAPTTGTPTTATPSAAWRSASCASGSQGSGIGGVKPGLPPAALHSPGVIPTPATVAPASATAANSLAAAANSAEELIELEDPELAEPIEIELDFFADDLFGDGALLPTLPPSPPPAVAAALTAAIFTSESSHDWDSSPRHLHHPSPAIRATALARSVTALAATARCSHLSLPASGAHGAFDDGAFDNCAFDDNALEGAALGSESGAVAPHAYAPHADALDKGTVRHIALPPPHTGGLSRQTQCVYHLAVSHV